MDDSAVQATVAGISDIRVNDEVKLWLKYLGSLNDRRLQRDQRFGLTNYVLVALLAGLLYRFVPQVPIFLASPQYFRASLIISALELNSLIYGLAAYAYLAYFCSGGTEIRLVPETRRRVGDVLRWTVILAGTGFGVFQIWIWEKLEYPSMFVKRSIIALGVWWLLNMSYGAGKEIRALRRARRHKIPRPRFSATMTPPSFESLVISVVLFCIALFSSVVLLSFLRQGRVTVIPALGAASVSLACAVICVTLFFRGLTRATEGPYEALERDILLDRLGPKEIRARFIRFTLGPDIAAWLDELLVGLRDADESLGRCCDSLEGRIQEVGGIDPRYQMERAGRAGALREELRDASQLYKDSFSRFRLQIDLFFSECKSLNSKEKDAFHQWRKDFELRASEGEKILERSLNLATRLENLSGSSTSKDHAEGSSKGSGE